MENLKHIKIPLKELSNDISSKLNDGFKKILILSPNIEVVSMLMEELQNCEREKCEVRIYNEEEYFLYWQSHFLHKRKVENSKQNNNDYRNLRTYEIDLYQIELT